MSGVGCTGGDVTYNLKIDTSQTRANITELNTLLTTYLSLARKTGLPPNIIDAMARIQQLRVAFDMAYRSAMLFYGATGPIGWALGLGGMAISGLMLMDQMEMGRSRY